MIWCILEQAAIRSNAISFSIVVPTPMVFRHINHWTSGPPATPHSFQSRLHLSVLTMSSTFLPASLVWPQMNAKKICMQSFNSCIYLGWPLSCHIFSQTVYLYEHWASNKLADLVKDHLTWKWNSRTFDYCQEYRILGNRVQPVTDALEIPELINIWYILLMTVMSPVVTKEWWMSMGYVDKMCKDGVLKGKRTCSTTLEGLNSLEGRQGLSWMRVVWR